MVEQTGGRYGWAPQAAQLAAQLRATPGYGADGIASASWWHHAAGQLAASGQPGAARLAAVARSTAGTVGNHDVTAWDIVTGTAQGTVEDVGAIAQTAGKVGKAAADEASDPTARRGWLLVAGLAAAGFVLSQLNRAVGA